jgi:FixJ family two-component response regulator
MKNRVAIVDDDTAARSALAEVLKTYGFLVDEYESGQGLLGSGDWNGYQCLLLDVRMPNVDGLELQQLLRDRGVKSPVIFITGHADVPLAVRAMRGGAFDFVEKPIHDEELSAKIDAAIAFGDDGSHIANERDKFSERVARLTAREREVMDLVVEGRSSAAIGSILGVSHRTVDHHRARVLEKMEVGTIASLIRFVLRNSD